MKQSVDPSYWPEHLQKVFREIGKSMAGKRLHPDVLQRMPSHEVNAILPDHSVCVEHRRGEASRPKGNHYVITIEGPRLGGQWKFWSGALEQLARASFISSHAP